MLRNDFHPSDQDLLLTADGELSARRAAQVRAHLVSCWDCRARMAELEKTIVDFARAHRQALDPHLPPIAGPRSLLRAQLIELADQTSPGSWRRLIGFNWGTQTAAYICVAFFLAALIGTFLFQYSTSREAESTVVPVARGLVPDRSLTPGATRPVAIGEVCSMAHEDVIRDVPTSLRRKVFEEYGIVNARTDDYEIDYLIAPGLGGSEDIRNLWPQPYTSPIWNAHVKDVLEERLHQLVCSGRLDLATAQRDIATDWIAAYKKYFHTNRPLAALPNSAVFIREDHGMLDRVVISDAHARCEHRSSAL
jgi:Putative zinc-finger